jgi:protein O-mannosyl-transferase
LSWSATKERLVVAGLAVGTVAVFGRVLAAGFAGFDDSDYVVNNPHVNTGLSLDNVVWAFTAYHSANWHPLTWLSLMLDVQLFGLRPEPMHAVNVLLHALNVALVYRFVRDAFGRQAEAAWVAALFAVHPLHVESVAWITERKDVLSTCFGLLSLLAYLAYARGGKRRQYAAAFVFLALGLMAKPMLVTWPFVFLLLDLWPLERKLKLAEKVPFFALVAAVSAVTMLVQAKSGAVAGGSDSTLGQQLANAAWGYAWYLGKTVGPFGLAAYHPFPFRPGGDPIGAGHVIGGVGLVAAMTLMALRGGNKAFRFGWLFFLGTLVPVIGLVRVGSQGVAERYMYVPSIGLFAGIVYVAAEGLRRRPEWRALIVDGAALAVAGLAALSWMQQAHWQSAEAVARRVLAVHPNAALMHFNLAAELQAQGRADEATKHLRAGLEIEKDLPDHLETRYLLAQLLVVQGRRAEARQELERLAAADPRHVGAQYTLAVLALAENDGPRALPFAERAVSLGGRKQVNPLVALSDALRLVGRTEESERAYDEAIALAEAQGNARSAADLRERREEQQVIP